jgi:tRNA pseudouridine55 synthase
MTAVFGFLNLNKPLGMTSHDVVARVRRGLRVKKVGHAGTLDPLATGVLILCLGGATRLSEYVMRSTKTYRARMHLGVSTATYDAEGEITATRDTAGLDQPLFEQRLASFCGDIAQIPPMYSAVKQGGKKLYELARAGEVVERPPRAVTIESLRLLDWSPPEVTVEVTCSAGTYIRSLAHDLGEALGVGAHLSGLVRERSGGFALADSVSLETLLDADDWQAYLVPPRIALVPMPEIHLESAAAEDIRHGRSVSAGAAALGDLAQGYGPDGAFLAILRAEDGHWRPQKVFV